MILSLEGDTSAGKSTLMYTGPLPMVVGAFDAGSIRALYGTRWHTFDGIDIQQVKWPPPVDDMNAVKAFWKRNNGRAITIYMLPQELQTSQLLQGNRVLWNVFTKVITNAIMDKDIKTVGVDTMTIARRVAADSYLETLQNTPATASRVQLLEVEWGKPGDYIRTCYTTAQNQAETFAQMGVQKHFVVTHHLTEQRVDKVNSRGEKESHVILDVTGKPLWQLEGLRNTYRFVDVALRLAKKQIPHPVTAGAKLTTIIGTYMKCGYDISLEGQEILSPTWDSLANALNTNLHPMAQIELRDKPNES